MQNNSGIPDSYNLEYEWLDTTSFRDVECALCSGANPVNDVFYFSINHNAMRVKYCIKDDLMFLSPQPAGNYTESLYNHESYFTGKDDMYGLAVSEEKSTEVAKIRIAEIRNLLAGKDLSKLSLLEIGSAYGHTLLEAKREGFGHTFGVEFSRDAVEHSVARGLDVKLVSTGVPIETMFPGIKFDVIAMYSVIEHVDNPVLFLESVYKLLAQQGLCVVRVPRMSKEGPWLSLLDHYWHFTESSLRSLAEKCGLKVVDVFPSGIFIGIKHEGRLPSMTLVAQKVF